MKTQIFKKTLIAFLAMLFLAATTVALLQFLPKLLSAKAEDSLDISYTQQADGNGPYFTYNTDQNRYTLDGIENLSSDKTATITLTFTGDKYLSFAYTLINADPAFLSAKIVVDGSTMTKSGVTNSSDKVNYDYGIKSGVLPITGTPDDGSAALKTWVHVSGEEQHNITITILGKGTAQATESCTFENFTITSEVPETKELVVVYDARLAELSFNDHVLPAPSPAYEGSTIVEHHIQIPVGGDAFALFVNGKKDIKSTIDPNQTTTAKYASRYSTTLEGASVVNFDGNVKTYLGVNFDNSYGFGFYDYSAFNQFKIKNPIQDSTAIVRFPFNEIAPKPDISITKNSDGNATEEQITNDCDIPFPYGSENHLTVRIKPYNGFTIDKYVILLDNQLYQEELQYFDGYYGFVLNDVYNRSVMIGYEDSNKVPVEEKYSDSNMQSKYSFDETALSFTTYLEAKGAEQSIVKSENVTVENTDTQYPWRLNPEFSTEDRIAYTSGFILKAGEYTEASEAMQSFIQIKTEATEKESGVLSFEFRLSGEYFMAMGVMGCLTGQAYYCIDSALPQDPEDILKACVTQPSEPKYPENIHLLASPKLEDRSKEIVLQSGCTELSNGWYRAEIQIGNAQQEHIINLAFLSTLWSTFETFGAVSTVDAQLTIRDVRFNTDAYSVTVYRDTNSQGTVTATIGQNSKTCSDEAVIFNEINAGSYVTLTAELGSNETFYGWVVNGSFYSREQEVSVVVGDTTEIIAYMAPKEYYKARNNGKFYTDLTGKDGALTEAASGDKIIFISSRLTISESFEIPTGVTVILPFNELGEYYGSGAPNGMYDSGAQIAWASEKLIEQNKKFELKIDTNAIVTVKGTLIVGGVLNHEGQGYQCHTSGAYAELILNGTINVEAGGVMDIYGRVTGTGSIDVKSGAKLYQPFLILDFPGGSFTLSVFNSGHTPFKRYAMVNIEVPFTIHHGAQLVGHASLWALGMLVSLDQPFISYDMGESLGGDGNGNDTMIMLKPESSVKVEYDPKIIIGGANATNCTELIGKTTLTFRGGADFSYMQFSAMGITIPTCGVYFSIPYNYHLILDGDGTYETRTDFMIMPGAVVEVKQGSTLQLHANTWVYDGIEQGALASKSYPRAQDLEDAGYSKSGNLIIDGKLIIDKKWEVVDGKPSSETLISATFLGIIQTNGTGKIEIPHADTVLNGTITDGLKDQNYFAYTTTARVWDAAHNCFGNLEAGHTYTATSGAEFELTELKYTTTEGGQETTKLDLNQTLHGSWKVEHNGHNFDWNPSDRDSKPDDSNHIVELTRQCTEIGCTKEEHKNLLYLPESLGDLTYKGAAYTLEEIKTQLFEEYFTGDKASGFAVNLSELSGSALTQGDYTVKAALTSGYFLQGEQYVTEATLKFKIIPFTITEANVEITQSEMQYTGEDITPTYSVTWDGEGAVTYEASWQDNKNAGEHAKLIITANGQFTGKVTVEFKITPKPITVTVKDKETVYTGEAQTYSGGMNVTDYTVSEGLYPSDNLQITLSATGTEAGDYNISGESANTNYTVTFKGEHGEHGIYKINPAPVTFTLEKQEYEYTGEKIQPKVNAVWGGSKTLDAGKYSIAYGDNTNVNGTNEVEITITSQNFTVTGEEKTKTLEFTITPKNITGAQVKVTKEYTYTGSEIQPQKGDVTVSILEWNKDIDFTVTSYDNNTNAGAAAKVTVTGNGNYTGTATGTFEIKAKSIDGATVTVSKEYTYTGSAIQPEQGDITVTLTEWDKEIEFVVSACSENTNAGKAAQVTVEGTGNYTGTATGNFTIKEKDVTVKVNGGNIEFGKTPEEPYELTITGLLSDVSEETLKAKLKYTVQNPVSLEAGNKYTVTPSFKDNESLKNYSVTFEAGEYTIIVAELSGLKFNGETTVVYNGESHKLEVTGLPAEANSAKVKYNGKETEPIDEGTYTVTAEITFENGAKHTVNGGTLTITAKTVQITVKVHTVIYNGAEQSLNEVYSWQDDDGILARDRDKVTITLTATGTEAKSYNITANESGDNAHNYKIEYTGLTNGYVISPKNIEGATVTVSGEYTYTGDEIKPQKSNITVTLKDWNLDITISDTVQYSQNTNASQEAKVTVTGSGNYTGEATGTFEIKAKSIDGATVTITTPEAEIVYKNAQWQPNFTVQVDGIASALTNKDYDVTYGANKSAGEGQITIKGKDNYTGEAVKTFTIKQKDVSITLESQEAEYNGAEQTVSSASDYWHADGLIEGDDLQVKLTGSQKEVGNAKISVVSVNNNYHLINTPEAVFTVTAKKINVTIKDQKAVYSNSAPEVSQTEWESDGICNNDNLNIKIEKSAGVTADKYTLTGSYSNPNYLVTFINERGEEQAATFEITKKKVTVTVTPKESVYGDDLAELSYTYDGVIEGDGFDIKNYIEISTDATQYSNVLGSYTISVKLKGEEAQNYAIDCTSTAAYTLTARPVKYTIDNQSSVYNGKVPQVAQKYTLKEGTVVNSDTLGITITAKELKKDAGKYALTGDWTNKNYAVTFEDGEYEITKLDISENITISVNEENNTDERGNIIAQYSGEPLEVLGMAYSEIEGDEELEIKVTTDVATIEKMGNYTVKATIDDKNYTGEKSFTVIVSDENGYTENIYKVLEELEERTKGINPDDLKEDDFEVLKEARKLIDSLTNDEQEAASEELAEYEQLIAAWNNATTVDEDVIKTAKNIADAPMSALIVIASVSAIAALAYVIGKGGKII